jgi:hypothetical protein
MGRGGRGPGGSLSTDFVWWCNGKRGKGKRDGDGGMCGEGVGGGEVRGKRKKWDDDGAVVVVVPHSVYPVL